MLISSHDTPHSSSCAAEPQLLEVQPSYSLSEIKSSNASQEQERDDQELRMLGALSGKGL